MITISIVAISMIVGLVFLSMQYAHGQEDNNQTSNVIHFFI
jgi:hypothetical protein